MKNKMGTMALTGVLALTAAFSMTAFAEESKMAAGGSSIVQGDIATTDLVPSAPSTGAEAIANFATTTGKIEAVTQDGENYTVSITNDGMGMVYHVGADLLVINRKDNSYMKVSDLKAGMEITGIVPGNSPQTMSLPPQTSAAVAFVVNEGEGLTSIGHFDGDLTNVTDKLKLNIDEKTVIVDQKGTKKVFTAEDVKNQDLVVFYTTATRSIPAQTSPNFVMILDVADKKATAPVAASELTPSTPAETAPVAEPKAAAPEAREMLALRATAEAAGYTVKWTSNNEPVVLEKGGITVSVTIGQEKFSKNGITLIASDATALKDAQIYIAADVADALK